MVLLLSALMALLAVASASAQTPCTHWASQAGGGNGLSQASPFRVSSFWAVAGPGKTLCLLDGVYTGSASMITPPTTLHGTPTQPITVRALNDGKVLMDAEAGWAVSLRATWWVVEGINGRNGGEFLFSMSGSHNRMRRVVGWNGTHGQDDSNIFRAIGKDNIAEDVAGWGINSRKIFDGAQAGNVEKSGFRRAWGEWNDYPQGGSQPTLTYQIGYNSTNQLMENIIGTWNLVGQNSPTTEGVMRAFKARDPNVNYDSEGTQILGSIFYLPPGVSYGTASIVLTEYISNLLMKDVVSYASPNHGGIHPFYFDAGCTGGCKNNVCQNCLSIHGGKPSTNASGSGFTTPNWREGNGLAAATGGTSPFILLPGICKRYVNGQLTNEPLWPWPMEGRIAEARAASGRTVVNVTAAIEGMLGPIPAGCRSGGGVPPPTQPPPTQQATLVASPATVAPGEPIMATWGQIASPTSADWIGLYTATRGQDEYLAWRYTTGTASGAVPLVIPAGTAAGTYELRLLAKDSYTLLATSASFAVGTPPVPPTPIPPSPSEVTWKCTSMMQMRDGKASELVTTCVP